MILRSKRAALDFKQNISMIAHEFNYECGYLNKYLSDSTALVNKANFLSDDAKIYSLEADNYFWSVNHNFYFSCSYLSMLMQIAEDLVNQYIGHLDVLLAKEALNRKIARKTFYEKVQISLEQNFDLKIKSKWWEELIKLYQVRNAFVHQNGALDYKYPDRVNAIMEVSRKYNGIEVRNDRVWIDSDFCKDALKIFENSLNSLFKETNAHINVLKKSL
ncbi:hypothetical protein ACQKCH_11440 [Nubsella zeaxanthinifaciens]|uniref:hypothetical protein n=1 Tax=Nubsella zeaxanthinifaciens TaxID=392412 RepID=UPI003D02D38C